MPAKSKAQRRFMAMCEHADHAPDRCPNMTQSQFHDFAATSEKNLPPKISKKADTALRNGYYRK